MSYYICLVIYILLVNFFKNKNRIILVILICLGIVLFQGFRDFSVGVDLIGSGKYISSYSKIGADSFFNLNYFNYEKGYIILNKVFYKLGINERFFLVLITCIIQVPIFYIFYKYSIDILMSVLWYFSFGNFLFTFSGLRQSIAMSFCFLAYKFIKNKQVLLYIITIVFASIFHKSALFCLILYPVYYIKLKSKKNLIHILGSILIIFVLKNKIFIFLSSFYYKQNIEIINTGAYRMFILYLLLLIISFLVKGNDEYKGLRNILYLLTIIYIFSSIHNYVTRIAYPLTLYIALIFPMIIKKIKYMKKLYIILNVLLIIYFFSKIGYLQTLPFKFSI